MMNWLNRLIVILFGVILPATALAGGGTASLTVTPWNIGDTINFGTVPVGQSGTPQGTTLTANAPIGISAQIQAINVVGSGDFAPTLGGANCGVGTLLSNGQNCSFPTVFTPSSAGEKTGTLRVTCQAFGAITAATVLCNGVEQTIVSLLGSGFVVSQVPVLGQWGVSLLGLLIFGLALLQLRRRP